MSNIETTLKELKEEIASKELKDRITSLENRLENVETFLKTLSQLKRNKL
jgi:prefoldin subunit 5